MIQLLRSVVVIWKLTINKGTENKWNSKYKYLSMLKKSSVVKDYPKYLD